MSSNLYWKQNKPIKGNMLKSDDDTGLKISLREEFGYPLDINLDKSSIQMLTGMRIAGYKSAQELIDVIEKYDSIHVWEQG